MNSYGAMASVLIRSLVTLALLALSCVSAVVLRSVQSSNNKVDDDDDDDTCCTILYVTQYN